MSKAQKVQSFRRQIAQSMAELDSIMVKGETFTGNDRFTVRTVHVLQPSAYDPAAVRVLREKLGVSQSIFAQLLGVSHVLVRSWERGARKPSPIAARLMDLVRHNPKWLNMLIRTDASDVKTSNTRRRRQSAA
jgi:DNA-binding transcriptional regulator YiaG